MNKCKVAIVGCGSVCTSYLPNLQQSPHVEVVALCDNRIQMAQNLANLFGVLKVYGDLAELLKAEDFDLLVNLTSMQFHAPLNELALQAGKHVWCEKPIAADMESAYRLLELSERKGLHLWGAPNAAVSPQVQYMGEVLASGEIGFCYSANAFYGYEGPSWGPSFYKKGGGSLFDLGVYNVTTLTALLGPVKHVAAMARTAIPTRVIDGEEIKVEADDNTALLLDHGKSVISVIQTGFVYRRQFDDWTVQLLGTGGTMLLEGYDWEPKGVRVCSGDKPWERRCTEPGDYQWQGGARHVAELLVKGEEPKSHGKHALHVLEVMLAGLKASETGSTIAVESEFPWKDHKLN